MRSSARCRESGRVKLASMANVVIQDRRRRNPPRANVDLGIELARSARPEAILLNIDMPGTSALQFMKLLRADAVRKDAPYWRSAPTARPSP
jgi:CheY-like chemotaxis protein